MAESAQQMEQAHRLYARLANADFTAPNALYDVGNPLNMQRNLMELLSKNGTRPALFVPGAASDAEAESIIDGMVKKAAQAILKAKHPRGGPAYPIRDTMELSLAISEDIGAER
jgi:hypothetical protein